MSNNNFEYLKDTLMSEFSDGVSVELSMAQRANIVNRLTTPNLGFKMLPNIYDIRRFAYPKQKVDTQMVSAIITANTYIRIARYDDENFDFIESGVSGYSMRTLGNNGARGTFLKGNSTTTHKKNGTSGYPLPQITTDYLCCVFPMDGNGNFEAEYLEKPAYSLDRETAFEFSVMFSPWMSTEIKNDTEKQIIHDRFRQQLAKDLYLANRDRLNPGDSWELLIIGFASNVSEIVEKTYAVFDDRSDSEKERKPYKLAEDGSGKVLVNARKREGVEKPDFISQLIVYDKPAFGIQLTSACFGARNLVGNARSILNRVKASEKAHLHLRTNENLAKVNLNEFTYQKGAVEASLNELTVARSQKFILRQEVVPEVAEEAVVEETSEVEETISPERQRFNKAVSILGTLCPNFKEIFGEGGEGLVKKYCLFIYLAEVNELDEFVINKLYKAARNLRQIVKIPNIFLKIMEASSKEQIDEFLKDVYDDSLTEEAFIAQLDMVLNNDEDEPHEVKPEEEIVEKYEPLLEPETEAKALVTSLKAKTKKSDPLKGITFSEEFYKELGEEVPTTASTPTWNAFSSGKSLQMPETVVEAPPVTEIVKTKKAIVSDTPDTVTPEIDQVGGESLAISSGITRRVKRKDENGNSYWVEVPVETRYEGS